MLSRFFFCNEIFNHLLKHGICKNLVHLRISIPSIPNFWPLSFVVALFSVHLLL